jgi:LPS export ABC transporter protein LptC
LNVKKHKQWKAPYLIGCLFIISAVSCRNDLATINALFTEEEVQYDIARQPKMVYTELGATRVEIVAPTLQSWNKNPRKTTFPDGLNVAFYEGRRNTSNLKADYGENHEQNKELVVSGNVSFKNDKGEHLKTEKLVWYEKTAKITAEGWVSITTPNEIITGYGLEADEDFSNYTISSISGIVNIEE